MLETAAEIVLESWAFAVEAVTERFGRWAGLAMFFLPWITLALIIWLVVILID